MHPITDVSWSKVNHPLIIQTSSSSSSSSSSMYKQNVFGDS